MSLNNVEFNECIQGKNGDSFEFRYEGTQKNDNIDKNNVQELITKFMNKYHGNMVTDVKILRTILKDYNERLLVISYQNGEVKETIKFDNSHISLFEKSDKDSEFTENFIVKFTPNDSISFMFTDANNKVIDYSNIKNISDRITKVLQEIYYLSHAKPIELDQDSKVIVEVYKLFYNENPDFSNKNINIKIQTMLSILAEFYISVGDYGFSLSGKRNIPMSMNLSNLVYELFPLGEIKEIDNPIQLREDAKKTISIVGEGIRNAIDSTDNKEEALITISKVIHAARYNLSSTASVEDVAKYTDCSSDEVESSMKLVKRINTKISNK